MTINDGIRQIEVDASPRRFARGWHCLGLARDLADGQPHQVNVFGQKLVVFTGEDGSINVLDAYCRHTGGDLSQGVVRGNEIACPFHDWRWGGDGRCKQIPYARRVGAEVLARKSSWDQTTVQWSAAALARCTERRTTAEPSEPSERPHRNAFPGCASLRASLRAAAVAGTLDVQSGEPLKTNRMSDLEAAHD